MLSIEDFNFRLVALRRIYPPTLSSLQRQFLIWKGETT